MDMKVTGATIRRLRERRGLTQAELAAELQVSDKAVSKWECGRGCPDVGVLDVLAGALKVSASELMAGEEVVNANVSANMVSSAIYVCPTCGNVVVASGEVSLSCHGTRLCRLVAHEPDEAHAIEVSRVEDELFVRVVHPMSKDHHVRFLAALSPDRVQLVRLYPEGEAEARFKLACVKRVLACCSKDGLFWVKPRLRAGR